MYFIKRIVAILILFLSITSTVYADDTITYTVLDYNSDSTTTLFASENYNEAYNFYISNVSSYQNLCLLENNNTLLMEYGIVYINSDESEVTYHSLTDECDKELINFNNYELLYLGVSGNNIKFALKGDIGLIDEDEVKLYPYNTHIVSYYDNDDGNLSYHVASSVNNYYKYNLKIDVFPDFLEETKKYYSNDGHYFYEDFYTMSDDYSLDIKDNSINKDNPYYNYYAYLPSRSYTNYTYDELNSFFTDTLGFNGRLKSYVDFDKDGANDVVNRSEYFGNINAFTSAEKIYGVNALTSLAWSCEESSFGKSRDSYAKSNVFNHTALEGFEEEWNKYSSVKSSIYSHMANFVSKQYCNEFSPLYVGSHIGDHMSGIASIYSNDPIFADRVVSKAYFIDSALGLKDRNTYYIGITDRSISLYYENNLESWYDNIKTTRGYSFIILDEFDNGYRVQTDHSRNQTGEYDPSVCFAYVKKERVDRVLEGKRKNPEYNTYTVYLGDSKRGKQNINLYSINDYDVAKEFVYRDIEGIEVNGYVQDNNMFVPSLRKIKSIGGSYFSYPSINNNGVVIGDGKIDVEYEDGTKDTKPACGDYILTSSNDGSTTNIRLIYNGVRIKAQISKENDIAVEEGLGEFVENNKISYSDYSFDEVKEFDNTFSINDSKNISTFINESEYDLNIAGAYPSFIYHSTDILSNIINTYYFDIRQLSQNDSIDKVVSPYGMNFVDAFNVSITRCFYKINLISPVIMQVKVPHNNVGSVYTIYHKDHNGDIVKIPTQFSDNYIKFMAINDGSYYVYSAPTASTYSLEDTRLMVNVDVNGVDFYNVAVEGILLFVLSTIGYLLYVVYIINRRKERKIWKGYKKLLHQAEFVPEEKQSN